MLQLKKYKKDQIFWGIIFIAPTLLGLMVLNIIPAIQTLIMSFQKSGGFGKTQWAGLENYQKLFSDTEVWQAVANTLLYTIIAVPFIIVLSMISALLLNQKIKGISFYRTLFFLPVVATPAAVAMIWRWLFNSDYGIINVLLEKIGIDGPSWLTNPHTAIIAIAIVGIWSTVGYNMVLLLSGLQEIPKDFYESANIDGASPIKQFFSITLPLVTPTLFFVLVTTIINSLQVFDLIFMMIDKTNAALPKTQSLVYLFYKHSFIMNDKGYGSAIVMILLMIIMLITAVQVKLQKKWVNY
ncbi:carbohydrate ABC transporter permease [Vagococcus sp.]|uniref:carbohydrate ABC transporter permease n=1 Tax=Vagococcus sp. TaxID=1933889 RepID=UPI003F9A5C85